MNLADRLRAVVAPPKAGEGGAPRPDALPVPACPAGPPVRDKAADRARLVDTLAGEWREDAGGRSFVVSRRYGSGSRYGHSQVGALADRLHRSSGAAPLVSVPGARAPFVFFDLETTGLSGGAGTYAFLVGCGSFEPDGSFVTEQHLLVDYASERGMLTAVAAALGRAGAIVSFNGKSFDAPVLETRYLFHRLAPPCSALPHVDVLHPARRFWSGDGEAGCSLIALEQHLLGTRRSGDVPGFEIPARYFRFVRTGDAGVLEAVLEHNRLDLLSLAGVTARLLHLVQDGPGEAHDAREALALGRVYTRAGQEESAEQAYEHAIALTGGTVRPGTAGAAIRAEALRCLALVLRRGRRFEAAAARWRELLDLPGCPRRLAREAAEALAIHHEHRVRDLGTARLFALRTLEMQGEAPACASSRSAAGDGLRHRLARLERKLVSERRTLFPSSPSRPSSGSPMSAHRTSS